MQAVHLRVNLGLSVGLNRYLFFTLLFTNSYEVEINVSFPKSYAYFLYIDCVSIHKHFSYACYQPA